MKTGVDLNQVNERILKIKALLQELEALSGDFPSLSRNSKRALASLKMMELSISDVVAFNLMDA